MEQVILVIHLMIAAALVGVILLQRSEGGALGIGGGGGGGMSGFLTGRSSANLLTRTTAILAAAFMVTSLTLGWLSAQQRAPSSILDRAPLATTPAEGTGETTAPASGATGSQPAPAGQTPASSAPAEPAQPAGTAPSGAGSTGPSVPLGGDQ